MLYNKFMEFQIITDKKRFKCFTENYPSLTEEATMSPSRLLAEGYWYNDLIDKRETPVIPCVVEMNKVYAKYSGGREYIGRVNGISTISQGCRVRIDGGQKIKVVKGETRDKKVEVSIPYEFVLVVDDFVYSLYK